MIGITYREAAYGLFGAWRLARGDADGLNYFENSVEGFWRSFWAAAVIAPVFLVVSVLRYEVAGIEADPLRYAIVESIAYVIAWVLFPVVMVHICTLLERAERFILYIVAYNWAAVLQNALLMPLEIAGTTGLIPLELASLFRLLAFSAILFYVWFVAKVGLDLPPWTAVGIVVLDLVLMIFVNSVADALY